MFSLNSPKYLILCKLCAKKNLPKCTTFDLIMHDFCANESFLLFFTANN